MTSLRAGGLGAGSGKVDRVGGWRDEDQENRVRHVVIREAEIVKQPSTHVVYKINVLTQWNHWSVLRRYSEFFQLHSELVQRYKIAKDLLPPKRLMGNFDPKLIESRREALEHYLQRLVNSHFEVATSKVLSAFLDVQSHDVIQVAKRLARRAFEEGDATLSNRRPCHYTPTEMFCICKRLKLPMADGDSTDGGSMDLSHLYSFINQLEALSISVPAGHPSSCNMPFSLAHFRALRSLSLDACPLALVEGLSAVHNQLRRLCLHHILNSLKAVIEDAAVERRSHSASSVSLASSGVESWRHGSIVSLTADRPVMQPWTHLTKLDVSRNRITALDDSLRLLPSLQEANFSFNMLQSIDLGLVCVGNLKKANFSHNQISTLYSHRHDYRQLQDLNLSHNRLRAIQGLESFSQLRSLLLDHNALASHTDLQPLSEMGQLRTLQVAANPYAQRRGYRVGTLAMLPHCSSVLAVDGAAITPAEQVRLDKLSQQHGSDTSQWPDSALRRTGSFVASSTSATAASTADATHGNLAPRSSVPMTPTSSASRLPVARRGTSPGSTLFSQSVSSPPRRTDMLDVLTPVFSTPGSYTSTAAGSARPHAQAGGRPVSPIVTSSTRGALHAGNAAGVADADLPVSNGEYRVLRFDSGSPSSEFSRNPFNDQNLVAATDHYLATRSWSPPEPDVRPLSRAHSPNEPSHGADDLPNGVARLNVSAADAVAAAARAGRDAVDGDGRSDGVRGDGRSDGVRGDGRSDGVRGDGRGDGHRDGVRGDGRSDAVSTAALQSVPALRSPPESNDQVAGVGCAQPVGSCASDMATVGVPRASSTPVDYTTALAAAAAAGVGITDAGDVIADISAEHGPVAPDGSDVITSQASIDQVESHGVAASTRQHGAESADTSDFPVSQAATASESNCPSRGGVEDPIVDADVTSMPAAARPDPSVEGTVSGVDPETRVHTHGVDEPAVVSVATRGQVSVAQAGGSSAVLAQAVAHVDDVTALVGTMSELLPEKVLVSAKRTPDCSTAGQLSS